MKIWSFFGLVACATLLTGCIHHHSTVHREAERVKVQFENEAAGRLFYERLSKMPGGDHKETKTQFSIPVVFDYERNVVSDDNSRFNNGVRECDTNGDGIITLTEAKIFAGEK